MRKSSRTGSALEALFDQLALDDDTRAVLRAIAGEARKLPSAPVALAEALLERLGPGRSGWESPRIQRSRRALTAWLDGATDGPARGPAVLRDGRSFGLTFGGQGGEWLDELA